VPLLFLSDGICPIPAGSFLGLSIAEWSLICSSPWPHLHCGRRSADADCTGWQAFWQIPAVEIVFLTNAAVLGREPAKPPISVTLPNCDGR